MAVVSDVTIARAALAGGWPSAQVATAVAVALAESSGDATATNRNTNGTTDYGLWQINSIHKADLAGGNWQDPTANARMAYAVFKRSNGWSPWYAWRDGKHLKYMARGTVAAINAQAGGAIRPIGDEDNNPLVPDFFENPADGAGEAWAVAKKGFLTLTDRDFWVRTGMFVVGLIILFIAVIFLFLSMFGRGKVKQAVKVAKMVGGKGGAKASTATAATEASEVTE